jgi:hypothetical protein
VILEQMADKKSLISSHIQDLATIVAEQPYGWAGPGPAGRTAAWAGRTAEYTSRGLHRPMPRRPVVESSTWMHNALQVACACACACACANVHSKHLDEAVSLCFPDQPRDFV